MVSSSRNIIACILLILCSTLHAYSQKPATGSVSGKVTIKDKGVAGIVVIAVLNQDDGWRGGRHRSVTDQNGIYRISNLPAGKYELRPFMQAFAVESDRFDHSVLVGEGEAIEDVNFTLARGGVITGKITDADGQPMIEQSVHLMPLTNQSGIMRILHEFSQTDDRGIFRIYGLPPGKYKVWTGQEQGLPGGGRQFHKKTFYPSVADEEKAAIIEVTAGSENANIDIVMGRPATGFKVTGRIIDGDTGKPLPGLRYGLVRIHEGGSVSSVGSVTTNANGEFRFDSVMPGKYAVFLGPSENNEMRADSLEFDVVDRDVSGLEMKSVRGATISGVVVLEGVEEASVSKQISELRLYATIMGGGYDQGNVQPAKVNPDGSFTLKGLRSGAARLGVMSFRHTRYGIVRIERDGVVQPLEFSIKDKEHITGLRVVVHYNNGTIRGEIKLTNGNVADFYIWIQLSRLDSKQTTNEGFSAEVDARGKFQATSLAPGTYEVTVNAHPRAGGAGSTSTTQEVTVTNDAVSEVHFTLEIKKKP